MLTANPATGEVRHAQPGIHHAVAMPNKRQVLAAWERISQGMECEKDRDVVQRALGIPKS